MSDQWNSWERNVIDKYRDWSTESIKEHLQNNANPFAVCMEHWQGDFNIAALIRNANVFNAEKIIYLGKKRYDRRGCVGTHHYTNIVFLDGGIPDLVNLKNKYTFIAVENNISKTEKLHKFNWNKLEKPPLFFFGEEGYGLTEEVLNLCDYAIEIEQYGSVPSMNVGTCSGIIMYSYVNFLKNSIDLDNEEIERYDEICNAQNESSQLLLL